jgi:hypothetical protein
MRPYLVLCAVALVAVSAFGQENTPQRFYGGPYGYGPYVPLITTPMISFQQFSPNPVGATNATTGLIAGATNSTLSEIQGSTSSVYTVPVWYQDGAPLIAPAVNLFPEPIGREGHVMRHPIWEERPHERGPREEKPAGWLYFTGSEHTADVVSAAGTAKGARKAGHIYTNDDVTRQNDNNGSVKYGGKTEKM